MDIPVTHHVACGLLVRAEQLLLVHRSPLKAWYPNVWDLPGGHLERGEDGSQALVRELGEELGIEISPPGNAPLFTQRKGDLALAVWRIDSWVGTVVNAAPDEHDSLGWFSVAAASALELADDAYPALFAEALA